MTTVGNQRSKDTIRFVDFCAGLGGFHRALSNVSSTARLLGEGDICFTCVAAAELEDDLRACYVKNFPDVSTSYRALHRDRKIAEFQLDLKSKFIEAMPVFSENGELTKIHGDIRYFLSDDGASLRNSLDGRPLLPEHDLLCAGFPCQPFSKSGSQRGFEDTRGTVFHSIATIIKEHSPAFVLLENVGNFARHDGGNTWMRVQKILQKDLGYNVIATEHVGVNVVSGSGLLSPHHLGYPHHRERFFMLAQRQSVRISDSELIKKLLKFPLERSRSLPSGRKTGLLPSSSSMDVDAIAKKALVKIIAEDKSETELPDLAAAQVSLDRVRCINHWGTLLKKLDELDKGGASPKWKDTMPSFPIWGYELDPWNWYPIDKNPGERSTHILRLMKLRDSLIAEARAEIKRLSSAAVDLAFFGPTGKRNWLNRTGEPQIIEEWVQTWPSYAGARAEWPAWKQRFISQNRKFALRLWSELDPLWLRAWLEKLYAELAISSYIKLEWNCKGESLDIWSKILQFRPSGLRVKRLAHVPALVAMTTTQIPIVPKLNSDESSAGSVKGARGRHLIPSEALQLQGFPPSWNVPLSRERAFTCFGNAVHVGVVHDIFVAWFLSGRREIAKDRIIERLA